MNDGHPIVWTISDGKAGMDVQAIGVARALGVEPLVKHIAPKGIFKSLAPWGPVAPTERFGRAGSLFAPPWPTLAIATGRQSIPYIKRLKRCAGNNTVTIVLQDPRTKPGIADFVWVPEHDRLRGPNVFTTLTAPSSFTANALARLRSRVPESIERLPAPRVAVFLGGDNAVYRYTPSDCARLNEILQSFGALGASFLITPSRRTSKGMTDAVDLATNLYPRLLWNGEGANPYADFLAHADAIVVTADSINMVSEACASGVPVFVFHPSGGSSKFAYFHEQLEKRGLTRPLRAPLDSIETWAYDPLFAATEIAAEVQRRWPELLPASI